MNANKIKGYLLINGGSVVGIARELGVSRQAVYQTINGEIRSPKIMAAISSAIGKPVEKIWPDAKPAGRESA